MTMETQPPITSATATWFKIVDGASPVETLCEANCDGRLAYGSSAPAAGVVGYSVAMNVQFVVPECPNGISAWFKANAVPFGDIVMVTTTPAE